METKALRLTTLVNIGSLLVVLLACGGVLWNTYGIAYEVKTLRNEVNEIKANGTQNFQRHEKLDDFRVEALQSQISDVKDAIKRLTQVQIDLSTVGEHLKSLESKLDGLKEQLSEHERRTK